MKQRVSVIALAAVAIGLLAVPAMARSITAIAEPSHGPIQIVGCRATYDSDQLAIALDFKNNGDKVAARVDFSFTAEDPFGQTLRYLQGSTIRETAPGAEIDNWQGASVSVAGPIGSNLTDVKCAVEAVHFKDGSEWHGDNADSTSGYPPTPNPEGTPDTLR